MQTTLYPGAYVQGRNATGAFEGRFTGAVMTTSGIVLVLVEDSDRRRQWIRLDDRLNLIEQGPTTSAAEDVTVGQKVKSGLLRRLVR